MYKIRYQHWRKLSSNMSSVENYYVCMVDHKPKLIRGRENATIFMESVVHNFTNNLMDKWGLHLVAGCF
jgi:hypothetical protein